MMKIFFLFLILMTGLWAQAESLVHPYGVFGLETRLERNQDQDIVTRGLLNYSLGFSLNDFLYAAEYSYFKESTGSSSLSVNRTVETADLFADWMMPTSFWLQPLLGVGFGASAETIDTKLLGATTHDHGRPNYFIFANLGVRANIDSVWVSTEARFFGYNQWDPNPTLGLLAKIGFYF